MSRWTIVLAAVLISALIGLGCSSGSNPVMPAGSDLTSGASIQSGSNTQTHLWGYYDLYFDFANSTVEAVPNRDVMFAANVVEFLNGKPTNMGFNIIGTPVDPNFIDVDIDVTLTHPFPGLNQYDGYDVRGIFIGNGSGTMAYNGALKYAVYGSTDQEMYDYNLTESDIHSVLCGNPDGYTRWWNQAEFTSPGVLGYTQGKLATPGWTNTATLNPFKYFADGIGIEDDAYAWLTANQATNGVFTAGASNTRNYYLRFPMPDPNVKYGYAVVANWKGEAPEDHPANAPEPIAVSATVTTPDLYYVDAGNKGGDLILEVNVYDWDAEVSVTTGMVEDYALFIESSVLSAPYQLTGTEMEPIGGGEHYSTFAVDIPSDNITGTEGNYYWVIAAEAGETYENEFGVTNLAGTDPLAAFFRYDLYVSPTPYCPDVTVTDVDTDGLGSNEVPKGPATGITVIGTGFEGPTSIVKFIKGATEIVATNVTVIDSTSLTCDADFTGQASGYFDVFVENDCGNSNTGLALVVVPFDIRPWDGAPCGGGAKSLTKGATPAGWPPAGWTPVQHEDVDKVVDIAVRYEDAGVFGIWADNENSNNGWIDRWDPTLASVLNVGPLYVYNPISSQCAYGKAFIETANDGASGIGVLLYPGWNWYGTDIIDPTPGSGGDAWGGSGFVGYGSDHCPDVAEGGGGHIMGWHYFQFYGTPYFDYWEHYNPWGYPNYHYSLLSGRTDFDGIMSDSIKGMAAGTSLNDLWGLNTTAPHVHQYSNSSMTAYGATSFGNDGTADGEISNPIDISMPNTGGRIYVLDQPQAGRTRIQCFDTAGALLASSEWYDATAVGGGNPYRMDFCELTIGGAHFMYVLYDNNTVQVFRDFSY